MAEHCVSIGYGYGASGYGGYVIARCSCGWAGPARTAQVHGWGRHRADVARMDALDHVRRN